jgi:hypothetical protein
LIPSSGLESLAKLNVLSLTYLGSVLY